MIAPAPGGFPADLWIRTLVPRAAVERLGGGLVPRALAAMQALWPLYLFMLGETGWTNS